MKKHLLMLGFAILFTSIGLSGCTETQSRIDISVDSYYSYLTDCYITVDGIKFFLKYMTTSSKTISMLADVSRTAIISLSSALTANTDKIRKIINMYTLFCILFPTKY